MKTSLYELVGDYKRLEEGVEEYIDAIEAGEIDEDVLWDTLDAIHGDIAEKCDSIVQILRNKEVLAASLDEEIKRLTARKRSVVKANESLKEYLSQSLAFAGIDKLDTVHARLTFRASERCDILDEDTLIGWAMANGQLDLLKIPSPEVSTSAVKAAIKAGAEIPGAKIVKFRNIQIK